MSKTLTDDQRVIIIRSYVPVGHTKGQPFNTMSIIMYARDYNLYPVTEVQNMLEEIALSVVLGESLTTTQKFALDMLQRANVVDAFAMLAEAEED